MNKINKLIKNPLLITTLLSHCDYGYLNEIGWIDSWIMKKPINKDKAPLPWVTYSFIDFIEKRLSKKMNLFEYGSGNSTLYYANKVCSITSVEHDKDWFNKISDSMPNNSKLIYQDFVYGGEYSSMAEAQEKNITLSL